jgi:hypothetical protein
MSKEQLDAGSAKASGVKGWDKFPWVYLKASRSSHILAEELNAQYFHKHIDTRTYVESVINLLKSKDASQDEHTRSLYHFYARGDIDAEMYLRLREPERRVIYSQDNNQ